MQKRINLHNESGIILKIHWEKWYANIATKDEFQESSISAR